MIVSSSTWAQEPKFRGKAPENFLVSSKRAAELIEQDGYVVFTPNGRTLLHDQHGEHELKTLQDYKEALYIIRKAVLRMGQ